MSAATSASTGKFVSGSILRHVLVMSLSSGAGLLAVFLVDLADLFFIALLGEAALAAAIGYAGSALFFVTSISIGLAIAMGALTARALGRGDTARARQVAGSVFLLMIAVGVLCCALLVVFAPAFLAWLGASGDAHAYGVVYLRICALGTPFLILGMAGGALLRSHGDARRAMTTTISAALANAILDPLLIFGLGLGLSGAAIATVIARFVLFAVAWRPIFARYGGIEWPSTGSLRADLPEIFRIAGPGILTNVATPAGNAFVTRIIAEFGTQAVAGYAIVGRLTPFAFCVIFALSGAVGPIIGQNYGVQRFDRIRATMRAALGFVIVYVLIVAGLLFLLRAPIADVFGAEGEARDLVYLFCGPLALAFFFNGALFSTNAAFNNLDRPLYATALNWGRNTIGTVPFVALGASWYGPGGALAGQYIGGAIFSVIAVWLVWRLIEGHAVGDPPTLLRGLRGVSRAAQWPFSSWRL